MPSAQDREPPLRVPLREQLPQINKKLREPLSLRAFVVNLMTILSEIFAHKRVEVEAQKKHVPLIELRRQIETVRPPLDFAAALKARPCPALIAEVKKGSPSKGVMVADFDPIRLAKAYAINGAAAISVLTDEKYFGGSLEYLRQIAALNLGLPLLRKEFVCDAYQIYEARAAGADAVLLIVAELSDHELITFQSRIRKLGMAALVEVHTRTELTRALNAGATLIGINNRNLRDFSVSLETTRRLRPLLPASVTVVAESGISSPQDFRGLNVEAVLVGLAIVRAGDVGAKVRELSQTSNDKRQAADAPELRATAAIV
jgi:indole-3-glycerol phosphate synthase